jgi:hypothetical protein
MSEKSERKQIVAWVDSNLHDDFTKLLAEVNRKSALDIGITDAVRIMLTITISDGADKFLARAMKKENRK